MAPIQPKQSIDIGTISTQSLMKNNQNMFSSQEVIIPKKKKPVDVVNQTATTGSFGSPVIAPVIQTPQQVMTPMSQEIKEPMPQQVRDNLIAGNVSPQSMESQPERKYLTRDKVKSILVNAPEGVDKSTLLDDIVANGYILEGYNDPQSQITQAPVPVAPQISYGENKIQDQKQPGSLRRGIASLGGDMGNMEWLNPVGKVFENVDNAIQKIPVVTKDNVANAFNKLVPGFGDSMVEGGGPNVIQMLANVPGSLLKTTSATARGITNPVDTMQGLYKLVATDEGQQVIKDRYGSIDNFAKSMDQDPVGVASDILTVVQGGASLAGGTAKLASAGAKSAGFAGTAGKLASFADEASRLGATAGGAADLGLGVGMNKLNAGIGNIASKPLRIAAKTALAPIQPLVAGKEVWGETKKALQGTPGEVSFVDRAISAYNGLDSETVRQMKDQPEIVKALDEGKITKESIKSDLVDAVDQVTSEKNAVGSQYSEVYNNPTRYNAGDIITDINKGLTDQGVVIEGGKIVGFDTTKMTGLTDQAKTALKSKYEDVIATLKSKTDVGVEDLHNIRKDMYMTSYQDGFMTKKAPGVSKVSDILNERLKKIPGFNELDAGYREAADLAKEIKDSVVNKEGDFKGTLKALLGERGAKRMDILDKHFPGLKDKIKTLAAYDDYLNTRTRKKVGMYEKAGTAGAAALGGFMLGGPLGAIISGIAGPILSDFIRDPKWFKNYIISKAGKEIASKIELGTELDIAEKTRLNRIISELEKDPQKALPYKPTQATPVSPKGQVMIDNPQSPIPKKSSNTVIEKGVATKPGTTKVNPQAIVKKSEVVKAVDLSVETLKKLQSDATLQKVQPFERIPSNVKGKGYTTQYGDIEKVEFDRGREVYEIGGKTYKASDVEIYKPKEAPVAKKFTTEQELKIDSLKKYKEQGQRKRSYLQELLNGKSIDSLEPKQVDDFFEMVNKRKRDDTAMSKLDTVKQGETPVKTVPKTTETKIEPKKATVDQELQNIAKKVKEKSIAKKENGSIMDGMKTIPEDVKDTIFEYTKSGAGEKVMPISRQKEVSKVLPQLPRNTERVYAGLTLDSDFINDNLYDGGVFESKRLLSSSTDLDTAESFADYNPKNLNKVVLEIERGGHDVSEFSRYGKKSLQGEKEVLFPIGSKFDVEKIDDGYYKLSPKSDKGVPKKSSLPTKKQ